MPFLLDSFAATLSQVTHPEKLRNILILIFREAVMRGSGHRTERTGFEAATNEELELAFIRTVNELVVRWGQLQDQLGNHVVSDSPSVYCQHCSTFHRIFSTCFKVAGAPSSNKESDFYVLLLPAI